MSEHDSGYKPDTKAIASDMYKEVAKWLFELGKPLITTAAVAVGVFIAGQMTVFGAFLVAQLAIKRYQLFLWILLGAGIGICVAALYLGRRIKKREEESEKRMRGLLAAAEEKAAQVEALASKKLLEFEQRALSAEEIAARDPLTGLFNLRELERRIVYEAKEALEKKQKLSIILLDIDGFGETNQKYGYPAGDSILKQFARGLIEGSRRKDPFFRYRSGDEFAVLALSQGRDDSRAFAERMRRETESSEFEVWDTAKQRHFLKITISAGVTLIPSSE